VARAGGNVSYPGVLGAGGVLVDSDRALARACRHFARDRGAHARAARLAWQHARPPRSFSDAARDFAAQMSAGDFAEGA